MEVSQQKQHKMIESVMASPVVVVDADSTLRKASEDLRDQDVGTLVVMAGEAAVGIISERDVVRAIADGADADRVQVSSVMTEWPRYVTVGEPVEGASQAMLAAGIRHLPVFDEGELIGIVSIRDLTEALLRHD